MKLNNFFSKIKKDQLTKERLLLILIITILVIIWFRKGLILGSGESGLPFYNTSKLLDLSTNSWTDVPIGTNSVIGSANYPYYGVITFLENIGIPAFILQAALYWLLFVSGVLSIHKIATYFKDNSFISRISSSLFYIFNPVAHLSVLHRFQYTLMFFYFFMPLAFLIFFKGLKERNFVYIIILSLVCIVFSPLFIGVALMEMFFGVLALLSIFYFIDSFKKKRDWYPIFYFLGFVITFVLVHAWWLSPLFLSTSTNLGTSGFLKYFSSLDNVEIFLSISQRLKSVLSVFRLFPIDAFSKEQSSWGWIYGTVPFVLLSFSPIIIFIIGLFRKRLDILYKFFIFLSILTMFSMKGSLPPFGNLTLHIFKSSTFLHAFRNPFEKIGMLLPFAMAIPIGFGVAIVVNSLAKKFNFSNKLIAFLLLTILLPIYMFPTVTGLVFTGGPPPANNMNIGQYVKVPDYYKDAREWLNRQDGLFRVLTLPINGEGMTYKWEYGFSGVELSNNLFDHSMISFNSSQAFLPEMIGSIDQILSKFPDRIADLAQLLNVRYIMVRDDIDYLGRETADPKKYVELFETKLNSDFTPVSQFDKLKFYEINPKEFRPRIYANVSSIYTVDPIYNGLNLIPFTKLSGDEIFINSLSFENEASYINDAKKIILSGVRVENIEINNKNASDELPYVTTFRDSPFYNFVRLKENFQTQFQTRNRLLFKVSLLGKRLLELNHSPEDILAIKEYVDSLKEITPEIKEVIPVDAGVINSLLNQRQLLGEIKGKVEDKEVIDKIIADLDSLFIEIRAKSLFPTKKDVIHRFNSPKSSSYEILISRENWNDNYKDPGIYEFDLDGKTISLSSNQQNSDDTTISLGVHTLNQGFHEIGIIHPQALNLISESLPEEVELLSEETKPSIRTFAVNNLDDSYAYSISFEYYEEKGNIPILILTSDIDPVDEKGEKVPQYGKVLEGNGYDFGWKKFNGEFKPTRSSTKYDLSFKMIPYGDCKSSVQRPYRRYCQNPEFNARFLRESKAKIRNLKIEKIFQNPIVLQEVVENPSSKSVPKITFEQISPARYKVKVDSAKNPFFLVLSTAFDRGWNATFITDKPKNLTEFLTGSIGGEQISSGKHLVVNGYANSWYVEKEGSYEMFLEYNQEKAFVLGRKISLFFFIIAILILIRRIYARYITR